MAQQSERRSSSQHGTAEFGKTGVIGNVPRASTPGKPNQISAVMEKGYASMVEGCPCCAGQAVNSESGFNSLAAKAPWILSEWDYEVNMLSPTSILPRSHHMISWCCADCSHRWVAKPADRISQNYERGTGCPSCLGKTVHSDGHNSLASEHPEIVREFHPNKNGDLHPSMIRSGSGKQVWWRCLACLHEWKATPDSRTGNKKSGCPACANLAIKPDGQQFLSSALTLELSRVEL